jgi:hypothetical protein
MDSAVDTYNRQVYSIMGLLGDVGGIQEILIFLGAYIAALFSEKLMYAELFKKIYH